MIYPRGGYLLWFCTDKKLPVNEFTGSYFVLWLNVSLFKRGMSAIKIANAVSWLPSPLNGQPAVTANTKSGCLNLFGSWLYDT